MTTLGKIYIWFDGDENTSYIDGGDMTEEQVVELARIGDEHGYLVAVCRDIDWRSKEATEDALSRLEVFKVIERLADVVRIAGADRVRAFLDEHQITNEYFISTGWAKRWKAARDTLEPKP